MPYTLRLKGGRRITLDRMEMMGIINVTPDSFYAGSRMDSEEAALAKAGQFLSEGALFLDIGGESTRPGSQPVTAQEEIRRICPVIRSIRQRFPQAVISADTYRAETARAALAAGADLINDISGLTFEPALADVTAEAGAAVVIMHTGGRPDTMQQAPHYDDVVAEVRAFLERQIEFAVSRGIGRDQIMVDVGIGFGKTFEHNLALLRSIEQFNGLGRPPGASGAAGCPQLLAVSRKSFIGMALADEDPGRTTGKAAPGDAGQGGTVTSSPSGVPTTGAPTSNGASSSTGAPLPTEERLAGTVALTAFAAERGVAAARVHDVRENLHAARMAELLSR